MTTAFYKELKAMDVYKTAMPYPFSDFDRQLLTLLYQPMIGSEAVALYLTLWADGEAGEQEATHYQLMSLLGLPISRIFEARIQLEAIGLLKTFRRSGEVRTFLYELQPPLDPKTFFADPLLSMFLFSKIDNTAYRKLRDRFVRPVEAMTDFEDVSRTFTDIFLPVHAKAGYPEPITNLQERSRKGYEADHDFDFSLLLNGLSEQLVPRRVMTASMKGIIAKLAFLYGWGPLDMQKVILLALDEENKMTEETLKKAASEYYKITVSVTAPKLTPVYRAEQPKEEEQALPETKQDELVEYLESTPPVQVLRDIADGKEPLSGDIQLANQLVMNHGMNAGVVNVLLQYVMLRTDMKLTKSFAEKIASHWIRKKVTTAKEAMELARTEHDEYMKWKTEGPAPSKSSGGSKRKPVREEKLPEWFYKKEEEPKAADKAADESFELEKQKLLASLAMKKGKGE